MGLPLVPVLLQSAVASGLAVGRRVGECGLRVLLRAGIVGKRLRKGRGDNGEPRLAR